LNISHKASIYYLKFCHCFTTQSHAYDGGHGGRLSDLGGNVDWHVSLTSPSCSDRGRTDWPSLAPVPASYPCRADM